MTDRVQIQILKSLSLIIVMMLTDNMSPKLKQNVAQLLKENTIAIKEEET